VLCDPPYGQRLGNIEFAQSDRHQRFRYGLPGRTSSDVAFLQHAIACGAHTLLGGRPRIIEAEEKGNRGSIPQQQLISILRTYIESQGEDPSLAANLFKIVRHARTADQSAARDSP
jgi:hypothetical protein